MDSLRELVHIVSKQKVKKIEIIGNSTNTKNKMHQLYEGIHSGKFISDDGAAKMLYDSVPEDSNYKKLKYRLQSRLINTLFFLDTNKPSYNEYWRATYSCQKAQLAVSILLTHNARKPAIDLAKRTLRIAIQYEISDVALELSKNLRRYYSSMEGNVKKFNEYNELTNKYVALREAELKADEYCQALSLYFVKSNSSKNEVVKEMAIKYEKELKTYTNKMSSFNLNFFAYIVYVMRYEIFRDYHNTLKVCREAVDYLESRPFKNRQSFHFLYRELMCHIQLKQFKEGKLTAEKCLKIFHERDKGSHNWFVTVELFMILSFHARNYQKTIELLELVAEPLKSSKTHPMIKEKWKIYEAITHYFVMIGKSKPSESFEKNTKKFRISKFINEVPTISSDKRGHNITILIIQVLFLLYKKQYDTVIDKVEALDAYCYRYLRKDETFRSNCFIKMLLQLPKSGFHKMGVIRRAEKYIKKLQSKDAERTTESILIEIVPYEDLWVDILDTLENKNVKQRKSRTN